MLKGLNLVPFGRGEDMTPGIQRARMPQEQITKREFAEQLFWDDANRDLTQQRPCQAEPSPWRANR